MNILSDTLILSRLQFAVNALFHMIWPLLTMGLSIVIVVLETLWLKKWIAPSIY
jgi:cytochrome d ubiquinol oxidase subunit I